MKLKKWSKLNLRVYKKKKKKNYGPRLWMGFNCLKATATSRRQFSFTVSWERVLWRYDIIFCNWNLCFWAKWLEKASHHLQLLGSCIWKSFIKFFNSFSFCLPVFKGRLSKLNFQNLLFFSVKSFPFSSFVSSFYFLFLCQDSIFFCLSFSLSILLSNFLASFPN